MSGPQPLLRAQRRLTVLRYAVTGVGLLVLDMAVFFVLAKVFLVAPALAQLAARTAGAVAGFFGHKYFSFGNGGDARRGAAVPLRQAVQYGLVTAVTIGISPLVLLALLSLMDNLVVAKLGTEVVMVAFNYFCLSRVFR
ncbi:GtrA family protein [Zoogloea sp.]|uniref:GtrA family protein n=1 Tax=Zoogloea sp. TaxID=49181 RepID=UPI0035AE0D49